MKPDSPSVSTSLDAKHGETKELEGVGIANSVPIGYVAGAAVAGLSAQLVLNPLEGCPRHIPWGVISELPLANHYCIGTFSLIRYRWKDANRGTSRERRSGNPRRPPAQKLWRTNARCTQPQDTMA